MKCPVREAPVVFATARTLIDPDPATGIAVGAELFTTSQLASDVAVQVQVESGAVTVITQFASVAPTFFDAASSVTEPQEPPGGGGGGAAASCVTANVCVPRLMPALRAAALFAWTV